MAITKSELQKRIDGFRSACRKSGVKVTHQRLEIYREVAQSEDHPEVRTIFEDVRKRIPEVSMDTVYRTLWLLKDLGLLESLSSSHGHARFDANMDCHHHFTCTECGSIHDFHDLAFDALSVPDSVKELGSALTTHVEIKGICSKCQKRNKNKSARRKKGDE